MPLKSKNMQKTISNYGRNFWAVPSRYYNFKFSGWLDKGFTVDVDTSDEKASIPPTNDWQTLQFRNSTSLFSTRCDVIYKTLLRDCRKYFGEELQLKYMRKRKKVSNIGRVLNEYVRKVFNQYSEEELKQIKFYLGCLVYPKEMISSRVGLLDEDNWLVRGLDRK